MQNSQLTYSDFLMCYQKTNHGFGGVKALGYMSDWNKPAKDHQDNQIIAAID